jgi:hypothetical protein
MSEELVDHKVVIDDHVEVTLKIPKVMSALELKGLTTKATKLFNLAEVPIVQKKPVQKKPVQKKNGYGWTPEMDAKLMQMKREGKSLRAIGQAIGRSDATVYNHVARLKKQGRWKE